MFSDCDRSHSAFFHFLGQAPNATVFVTREDNLGAMHVMCAGRFADPEDVAIYTCITSEAVVPEVGAS